MTQKQWAIMNTVFKGADDGGFLTIDELRDRLTHKPSKQAIQCSIRFLEGHGFLERDYDTRAKRRRMVIKPTIYAFRVLRPEPVSSEPETAGIEAMDARCSLD